MSLLQLRYLLQCHIAFTNDPARATIITHGGNFHADDIFCNVFFGKFLDNAILYRSGRDLPQTSAIVYDIGFGELDHHQKGGNGFHAAESGSQPVPYASFGLVWKKFGPVFCQRVAEAYGNLELQEFLWDWMEKELVTFIDASDNGIYSHSPNDYDRFRLLTPSTFIALLNPISSHNQPKYYEKALTFAHKVASFLFDVTLRYGILQFEASQGKELSHPQTSVSSLFAEVLAKRFYPHAFSEKMAEAAASFDRYPVHVPSSPSSTTALDGPPRKPLPTSLAGLFWHQFGEACCLQVCPDLQVAHYLQETMQRDVILGMDGYTNGFLLTVSEESGCHFATPCFYEILDWYLSFPESQGKNQKSALANVSSLLQLLLSRVLHRAMDRMQNMEYVANKIRTARNHIMVLDRFAHWQEIVASGQIEGSKGIWFVIYPSNKGGYNVQPVICRYAEGGFRKTFPQEWYGCNGLELRKVSGIPTAMFVHEKGFLGAAETKEDAIAMAKKAIRIYFDRHPYPSLFSTNVS